MAAAAGLCVNLDVSDVGGRLPAGSAFAPLAFTAFLRLHAGQHLLDLGLDLILLLVLELLLGAQFGVLRLLLFALPLVLGDLQHDRLLAGLLVGVGEWLALALLELGVVDGEAREEGARVRLTDLALKCGPK